MKKRNFYSKNFQAKLINYGGFNDIKILGYLDLDMEYDNRWMDEHI